MYQCLMKISTSLKLNFIYEFYIRCRMFKDRWAYVAQSKYFSRMLTSPEDKIHCLLLSIFLI